MKLFRVFAVISIALIVYAVRGYTRGEIAPARAAQNVPQATQTAQERTPTPEPTQTPAPDFSATETAIAGVLAQAEATRQAGDVMVESAKAAQAAALLEAEKERTRQKQMEIDARHTSEANAARSQEIEATRQAEANRAAAIAVAQQAEQNRAKSLELEAGRLEQAERTWVLAWVMVAVIVVIVGVFVWAIRRPASQPASKAGEVTSSDWDEIPFVLGSLTRAKLAEIFPGPDELRSFANGMGQGFRPSHGVWVRGLEVFTETEFSTVQDGLTKCGFAAWKDAGEHRGGIAITDAGERFFRDVRAHFGDTTTPPLENTPLPGDFQPIERQIDSPETPDGEGMPQINLTKSGKIKHDKNTMDRPDDRPPGTRRQAVSDRGDERKSGSCQGGGGNRRHL